MNTLALKIMGGTVALGSIGTATYFGGKELFREITIKEQLSNENFKFIDFSNTEQWNAEFKSDQEEIKKVLNNQNGNGNSLKDWCKSKLDSTSKKKEDLDNVKKWCGIRSINSQLKRNKKTILLELTGSDVDQKWAATIAKRKQAKSDRTKLGLTGDWPAGDSNDTAKVKSWCEEKSKLDFFVKEETYQLVEDWCTQQA